MPDHDRPDRRAAFWGWVKAVSFSIPWWIAAISAYFSQEAAFRVFQIENKRLSSETARYTHETYRDYVSFRNKQENRLPSKCVRHLVARVHGKSGDYLISGAELTWIFDIEPQHVLQYENTRHAPLAACVDDDKLKALLVNDEDKARDLEPVRVAIARKIGSHITVLDAELVGYAHDLADKTIVCKNFSGFLQSNRQLAQLGYGPLGTLLWRMMGADVALIRSENYPNLFRFVRDLAAISNNFTAPIDCTRLPSSAPRDPTRLDWVLELLGARR